MSDLPGIAFTEAKTALVYLLAGNAAVSLLSKQSGVTYEYRITASDRGGHYVTLPTDIPVRSDNQFGPITRTLYLGRIGPDGFTTTRNSELPDDEPEVLSFQFVWDDLMKGRIDPRIEVRHTGRCGMCNRKLKDGDRILAGIGETCAKKLGLACD